MRWRKTIDRLLRASISTAHTRIVTCGLLVGLCYLPFWLRDAVLGTLVGAASLLMVAAIAVGFYFLWQQRHQLRKLKAPAEDRLLGYFIILGGIGLAPFCSFSVWSQKLLFLIILTGIVCSSWGLQFFKRYPIPTFLIAMGLIPKAYAVGKAVWEAFTPPHMLEQFMAWAGAIGLQAIGQPAVATNTIISLPSGVVDVEWACNGFNMAAEIAVASLILGLFLKQSLPKVVLLVVIGIVLALMLNIPRIMLMAMANAYWGEATFGFWHGLWGGQIFSTILFTLYYYILMAIVGRKPTKALT